MTLSVARVMIISLHLFLLNPNLFLCDQSYTMRASLWIVLHFPFLINSETVVSSAYFFFFAMGHLKSFIINRNNHGPSLVTWGIPEGMRPHSEYQSLPGFTGCCQSFKKSPTKRALSGGIKRLQIV